jgi:winged helix DNA-binding protein
VAARTRARTLTLRELNRALLARQLLLQRGRLSLPQAVERVGGLQAQYAPSMYIGLWSRVEGVRREQVTQALWRRSVVQATLMRSTIHLVSARDYWPLAVAIRDGRRTWWARTHRAGPDSLTMTAAAKHLRERLAGGPLRRTEIEQLLGKPVAQGVGVWLDLVRVPPSGTWERRRADLYAAAEDWLGGSTVTTEQSIAHLVRRYLGAFGPATPADIAAWAGVTIKDLAPGLERLALRRFIAQDGKELLDVPRGALPPAGTPAPVRFLPTWDAMLLAHARRSGILPERYRPLVFNVNTPQSVATFTVDGAVAGTWREDGGRVMVEPFEPLPRLVRREVEEEAARLERFLA